MESIFDFITPWVDFFLAIDPSLIVIIIIQIITFITQILKNNKLANEINKIKSETEKTNVATIDYLEKYYKEFYQKSKIFDETLIAYNKEDSEEKKKQLIKEIVCNFHDEVCEPFFSFFNVLLLTYGYKKEKKEIVILLGRIKDFLYMIEEVTKFFKTLKITNHSITFDYVEPILNYLLFYEKERKERTRLKKIFNEVLKK